MIVWRSGYRVIGDKIVEVEEATVTRVELVELVEEEIRRREQAKTEG